VHEQPLTTDDTPPTRRNCAVTPVRPWRSSTYVVLVNACSSSCVATDVGSHYIVYVGVTRSPAATTTTRRSPTTTAPPTTRWTRPTPQEPVAARIKAHSTVSSKSKPMLPNGSGASTETTCSSCSSAAAGVERHAGVRGGRDPDPPFHCSRQHHG
jgi:hypothetical protein